VQGKSQAEDGPGGCARATADELETTMTQTNGVAVPSRAASAWKIALATVLATAVGTGGARAADTPTETDPLVKKVVEHEALVAQHVKDKAVKALLEDAKAACALHKEVAARDDLRKRALATLETIVKNQKEESGRKTALEHVGSTGDVDAMKIVKPYLKQPDREKSNPVLLCAIQVAGLLPTSDCVEPLLGMVEDSKVVEVSAAAMEALGSFGKIKNKREKILTELCRTVAKWTPAGVARPKQTSPGTDDSGGSTTGESTVGKRWTTLAPILPTTLNKLTGQKVNTAEQWFQVVKDTPDLGVLFPKS
jgi:hypothetical protein